MNRLPTTMASRLPLQTSTRPVPLLATLVAGAVGIGIAARLMSGNAFAESNAPRKIFKGGPAFVSLPLDSSELVNHNTKRLRFRLPEHDAISGLPLTCEFSFSHCPTQIEYS